MIRDQRENWRAGELEKGFGRQQDNLKVGWLTTKLARTTLRASSVAGGSLALRSSKCPQRMVVKKDEMQLMMKLSMVENSGQCNEDVRQWYGL